MKFEGTIVKEPIIKEKIIITAIKLPNRENPIQVVVFPAYRDAETVDNIKAFKIDDKVIVYGNEEANPKSKELQIIVNKAFPANNAKQTYKQNVDINTGKQIDNLKYAIDLNVDFVVGGLSSYNNKPITLSNPREGKKQYYTDGDFYWYEGNGEKCPTSF